MPVDLYTGVPQITVPLFNLPHHNGAGIPIYLSYNASGNKVQDIASQVGLGWSLNAGGFITRTVRGEPDPDLTSGWADLNSTEYNTLYEDIVSNKKDSEHDMFYFSVPGRSGRFVVDKDVTTTYTLPHQEILIEKNGTFTDGHWVITDEQGTKYYFGDATNSKETSTYTPIDVDGNYEPYNKRTYVSTWYLTKIEYFNSIPERAITFGYSTLTSAQNITYYYYSDRKRILTDCDSGNINDLIVVNTNTRIEVLSPKYLYTVNTSLGTAYFNYDDDREDLANGGRLYQVRVVSNDLNEVKNYRLNHGYFDANDSYYEGAYYSLLQGACSSADCKRLALLSIDDVTNDGKIVYRQFDYANDSDFSECPECPGEIGYDKYELPPRNSFYVDHWGYFNGVSGINHNNYRTPPVDYTLPNNRQVIHIGVPKEAISQPSQANILKKIILETGGTQEFEYEVNRKDNNVTVGGLRIKKITFREDDDPLLPPQNVKTFSYSGGTSIQNIDYEDYDLYYGYEKAQDVCSQGDRYFLNIYSGAKANLFDQNGSPISYSNVSVSESTKGTTHYTFFSNSSHPDVAPNKYRYVFVGNIFNATLSSNTYPDVPNSTRFWERGLVDQMEVVGEGPSETEIKLLAEDNDYFFTSEVTEVAELENMVVTPGNSSNSYFIGKYKIKSVPIMVKSSVVTSFDKANEAKSSTTSAIYSYHSTYENFPKSVLTTLSDGSQQKVESIYVFDLCSGTPPALAPGPEDALWSMYTGHSWGQPVEVITSFKPEGEIDFQVLSGSLNTYQRFDIPNSSVAPATSYYMLLEPGVTTYTAPTLTSGGTTLSFDSRYKIHSSYVYDDTGNLSSMTDRQGISISFSYGYNNSLVLAKTVSPLANPITTSYEHIPLVGLSKITDSNGQFVTYEYDNFNRLKSIKDHNGDIMERYRYNYRDQLNELSATISVSGMLKVNEDITFTALYDYSSYGYTSYVWDFGDGTTEETMSQSIVHAYGTQGTKNVTVEMVNPEYVGASASTSVNVSNEEFVLNICGSATGYDECTGIVQSATTCVVTPDQGKLHFAVVNPNEQFCTGSIMYEWEFRKNNEPGIFSPLTMESSSLVTIDPTVSGVFFTDPGTYWIKCTVYWTGSGGCGSFESQEIPFTFTVPGPGDPCE